MSGLNKYEAGLQRIKSIGMSLAAGMGIYFAADKVISFVEGVVEAGKQINKVHSQITYLLRPMDDMATIQEGILNTAQRVGAAYTDVAGVFKEFLNESQYANISQNELLNTTENIYKALRVSKASAEQSTEVFDLLNRSFRLGTMRPRMLGALRDLAPAAFRLLQEGIFGSITKESAAKLEEMAKNGKLTADIILKAFSKTSNQLNADFDKTPKKLSFAFNYLYNQLSLASAAIWKVVDGSSYLAKAIMWLTDRVVIFITKFINLIGGLRNAFRLLGIAIAVAIGPWLIKQLALATVAMIRFAATNALVLAQWLLIGAAIIGAALAIEDFIGWIEGKESVIGDMIGPFTDLKKNFEGMDAFAPFRAIRDAFSGDFAGAWEELKKSIGSVDAVVTFLTATIGLAGAAFVAWNFIKFLGVISGITAVADAVKAVTKETNKATAAQEVLAGSKGKPAVIPAGGTGWLGILGRLGLWATVLSLAGDTAKLSPEDKAKQDEKNKRDLAAQNIQAGRPANATAADVDIDRKHKYGYTGNVTHDTIQMMKNAIFGPPQIASDASLAVDPVTAMMMAMQTGTPSAMSPLKLQPKNTWIGRNFSGLVPGMAGFGTNGLSYGDLGAMPAIAPGAMLPAGASSAGPTNISPTLNQSNNITVNALSPDGAEIGAAVKKAMDRNGMQIVDLAARTLSTAVPRVESPTQ